MADLMSGTYTYDDLKKKYQNFRVPAVKIKINGSNIADGGKIHIRSVQADLSLDHAGSVRVTFGQCYDFSAGAFDSGLKGKAVPGNVLEAEFGYGSDTLSVFKGYIAAVDTDFDVDDGITLSVTALDVRRLMMTGGRHYLLHDVKNYSDAFEAVMKPYKKLCSVQTDATDDKLEAPISQTDTDYDFVTKELIGTGRADREFFVLGDKAYFRKPQSNKTPVIRLGIGSGLYHFSRSSRYLNHTVEVVGYDPGGQNKVSGKASAKNTEEQMEALAAPGTLVFAAADAATGAEAAARAQIIAARQVAQNQTGQVSCVGLPQVVPGRYVEFARLDSALNKKYYVKEVHHRLDAAGFFTDFETEGWI